MVQDSTNRRRALKTIGTVLAGSSLAGCTGGGDSDTPEPTPGDGTPADTPAPTATPTPEPAQFDATVGYIGIDLHDVPLIWATEQLSAGSSSRLTAQLENFRGAGIAMQSMVANRIDYYALSPSPVYRSQIVGNDPKMIGSLAKGSDYVFASQPDITSFDQVVEEERSIGIASFSGNNIVQMTGVLQAEGYTVEEANLQVIGSSSSRTAALASGNIDTTLIHLGQWQRIRSEGFEGNLLFRLNDYFPNLIASCLAVPGSFLEDPTTETHAREFVRHVVRGNQKAMTDFDWIFENLQRYQARPLSREDARNTWDVKVEEIKAWPYEPDHFTQDLVQNHVDLLAESGVMEEASDLDVDQLVDTSYWDEALA